MHQIWEGQAERLSGLNETVCGKWCAECSLTIRGHGNTARCRAQYFLKTLENVVYFCAWFSNAKRIRIIHTQIQTIIAHLIGSSIRYRANRRRGNRKEQQIRQNFLYNVIVTLSSFFSHCGDDSRFISCGNITITTVSVLQRCVFFLLLL